MAREVLLCEIHAIFAERKSDRMGSEDLAQELAKIVEHPWPEWKMGKPITQRQIASLLKPLDIKPATVRFGAAPKDTARGYHKNQFDDAFSRYTPERTDTADTGLKNKNNLEFRSDTSDADDIDVLDQYPENANDFNHVSAVSDRKPPLREKEENDSDSPDTEKFEF